MESFKKTIAKLLAIMMIITCLPINVMAEELETDAQLVAEKVLADAPKASINTADVWDGSVAESFESGSGTEDDPYIIVTAEQLALLAELVNTSETYIDGEPYATKAYKLGADIVLNDETFEFMPDTGLVKVTDGTNVAYLGTGAYGDDSGENTIFDEVASKRGKWYASDESTEEDVYSGELNEWTPIGGVFVDLPITNRDDFDIAMAEYGEIYVSAGTNYYYKVINFIGNSENYYILKGFEGDFNGANFTVSGVYVNIFEALKGLFGCVDSGKISNANLKNSYVSGREYVGGIAGKCDSSAIISNCTNSSTISADSTIHEYVGGIVGYCEGEISYCTNNGYVTGTRYSGGIVGVCQDGLISNCINNSNVLLNDEFDIEGHAGGIVGSCHFTNVNNCTNNGNIKSTCDAGGITGFCQEGLISDCVNNGSVDSNGYKSYSPYKIGGVSGYCIGTIENCTNTGTITAIEDVGGIAGYCVGAVSNCENTGTVKGDQGDVGGIAASLAGEITDCINRGKVDGGYYCAGIVGELFEGAVKDCINFNSVDTIIVGGGIVGYCNDIGTINNCTNIGNISGSDNVGGIAGYCSGITITNCENSGNISGNATVGGIVGLIFSGTISNCNNRGDVNVSQANFNIGGIAGSCFGAEIINCVNSGNITGNISDDVSNYYNSSKAGGVVGDCSHTNVSNCINLGNIHSAINAGGISGCCGYMSTVTDCYNVGDVNGIYAGGVIAYMDSGLGVSAVDRCYSIGKVTCDGIEMDCIIGRGNLECVGNAYAADTIAKKDHMNLGTLLFESEMHKKESFVGFDFETVWTMEGNSSYPYPELQNVELQGDWTGKGIVDPTVKQFAEGDGTEQEPYMINTLEDFYKMAQLINANEEDRNNSYSERVYKLGTDIVLNDETFEFMPDTGLVKVTDGTNIAYLGTGFCGDGSGENTVFDETASERGKWYASDGSTEEGAYCGTINEWTPIGGYIAVPYKINSNEEFQTARREYGILYTLVENAGSSYDYYNHCFYYDSEYSQYYYLSTFMGGFDGSDHTISGIYINTDKDYQGLFGNAENAKISNVFVTSFYIGGEKYVGGVVGNCLSGEISNCVSDGCVLGEYNVGGITGYGSTLDNCTNKSTVFGGTVGGVAGSSSSVNNCTNDGEVYGYDYAGGGIVGNASGSIYNCVNNGTIIGKCDDSSLNIGGIAGASYGGTISNCINNGNIIGNNGYVYAGGIIGECSYDTVIKNCVNNGNVAIGESKNATVGGIAGSNGLRTEINSCINNGTVKGNSWYRTNVGGIAGRCIFGTIRNCYNTGNIFGVLNYQYPVSTVGGIAGYCGDEMSSEDKTSIERCYTVGKVNQNETEKDCAIGYIEGEDVRTRYIYVLDTTADDVTTCGTFLTDAKMRQQSSFVGFDFDIVWMMDNETDYPYPELREGMSNNKPTLTPTPTPTPTPTIQTNPFAEGDGTEENPYIIYTAEELYMLTYLVNTGKQNAYGWPYGYMAYKLGSDIVLNDETFEFIPDTGLIKVTDGSNIAYLGTGICGDDSGENTVFDVWESVRGVWYASDISEKVGVYAGELKEWMPIGNENNVFQGIFDGASYTISGIYVNKDENYQGLFGNAMNATMSNITVDSFVIIGDRMVGGVVGYYYNSYVNRDFIINNCNSNGIVIGNSTVGGIFGAANGGVISNCHNSSKIIGKDAVGGIVGECTEATIGNCVNSGNINSSGYCGGIAGFFVYGTMSNCVNSGNISGIRYVGGIVGFCEGEENHIATIESCYTVGNVVCDIPIDIAIGHYFLDSTDSYVDVNYVYILDTAAGNNTMNGGEILTDEQMRQQSSFVGFDFDAVWTMEGNSDYPYPELIGLEFDGDDIIQITDANTISAVSTALKGKDNVAYNVKQTGNYSVPMPEEFDAERTGVYKVNTETGEYTPVPYEIDMAASTFALVSRASVGNVISFTAEEGGVYAIVQVDVGDVNFDLQVNINDVLGLLKMVSDAEEVSSLNDVDGNNDFNINDILAALKGVTAN